MDKAANDDAPAQPAAFDDAELVAYVQGRLAADRARAVEGFLACNPDLAARTMQARHMRQAEPDGGRPVRSCRRVLASTAGVAACVISAALGWSFAGEARSQHWRELDGDRAPAYVEEAVMSHRATMVRAAMISQLETPVLDGDEVSRALGLRLPELPGGWRVMDVQVFPSDEGPGLNLVVQALDGRRLNLFVVRADTRATDRPNVAVRGGDRVVFWEERDVAFVLSGEGSERQLLEEAAVIARS